MPRIFIVTGEASGDAHGANLAQALRAERPDCELIGVGGHRMAEAGVDLITGLKRLDHMGFPGPSVLRGAYHNYRRLAGLLKATVFDAVVFIDHPGLNLRLARVAKAAGQRVVYYIAPQIWAWAPGRIKLIQRVVDQMLVILPFERALYQRAGVPCEFVGHPLLDQVAPSYNSMELRRQFGLEGTGPVIGLLPGSRESEVRSLLPILLDAANRVREREPSARFVLAQAGSISGTLLAGQLQARAVPVTVVKDQASEVMACADVLWVASGTATLQAAVIGTPMVLLYTTAWLTYWIVRYKILVQWIGLVNIVAGRTVVPELIQREATPERLSEEAMRLLRDPEAARTMKEALREVRESLGEPGASHRAAEAILKVCRA
ncbi:MAG: lipid-A-disaccharide synthase [Nitrospiraceae bacterium]